MDQKEGLFYEFGPFRLDLHDRLLFRNGQEVPLTPKAFDVLLVLVESSGHVVTKEELLKKVWAGSFVEEGNLNRHISTLRKALGDDLDQPKYIDTIPKRGYRFIAALKEIQVTRASSEKTVEQTASAHNTVLANRAAEVKQSWPAMSKWKFWIMAGAGGGFLLFLGLTYLWKSPVGGPQRALSRLTFEPGLQTQPTWSPDGRFIAYSSDRSGNFDIWVQPVGGGNPVQVTHSPAHDWQPDWSPNGKAIIFRSEREGGGLFLIPPLGGYETKVSSFGYRPRWSPDGSRILFVSSAIQNGGVLYEVYVTAPDAAKPQKVQAEFLSRFVTTESIAWHPDGRRISLWLSPEWLSREFWTVPLANGSPLKSEVSERVRRQFQEAAVEFTHFWWAPSGRQLYFEGLSRGVRNLWRVTVDPETLSWIAGPERLTIGLGTDADVAISPDGKRLAFSSRLESTRLWSLPFSARLGQIKGAGQPLTPTGMNAYGPELSRDGKKLAFLVRRPGDENRRTELRVRSLSNGTETMLVADSLTRFPPRWSRDGKRLAYARAGVAKNGKLQLSVVMIAERGGEEEIVSSVEGPIGEPFDWSKDDRWLLGSSGLKPDSGPATMCLYPISGAPHAERELRRLASDPNYNFWNTRFSPDERWICFNATSEPSNLVSVLGVLPSSGGGPWTQITEEQWADKPRWSPDGAIIYFLSNRKTAFFNIYGIHFDPSTGKPVGEVFQVTHYETPNFMISPDIYAMAFSLSETQLVLPIMQVSGSIWMLDNVDR